MEIVRHPPTENKCPVCGEKPVSTCRCMEAHSECPNGHKYHLVGRSKRIIFEGRLHTTETWYEWVLDN